MREVREQVDRQHALHHARVPDVAVDPLAVVLLHARELDPNLAQPLLGVVQHVLPLGDLLVEPVLVQPQRALLAVHPARERVQQLDAARRARLALGDDALEPLRGGVRVVEHRDAAVEQRLQLAERELLRLEVARDLLELALRRAERLQRRVGLEHAQRAPQPADLRVRVVDLPPEERDLLLELLAAVQRADQLLARADQRADRALDLVADRGMTVTLVAKRRLASRSVCDMRHYYSHRSTS